MKREARHLGGIRVIGLGNALRGDDGIGPVVAARLRAAYPHVDVIESLRDPLLLLELWGDAETVVVVDAVVTGASVGTLHRFEAGSMRLPAHLCGSSTHVLGLAEAIELARVLGRLPPRLLVLGIEAGRFEMGRGLSPQLASAVDAAVAMLARDLGCN